MRRKFAVILYDLMSCNENIILLTADLGYGMLDRIKEKFPDRFINTGAAEQAMMDMAVGIALSGKIPVVYSITPFLLFRPFETIRNYINHEKIPVIMVGSGRDDDYKAGFSHYAGDHDIIRNLENIEFHSHEEISPEVIKRIILSGKPSYINLRR